mgnify:FL=1
MSKRKRQTESFMQGVFAIMFSQVLIKIFGMIYKLYLTNKEGFGDAGNAIYSSGFQIYALLLTLSSIGVPNAISKLVAERLAVGDSKGAHRIFKVAFATFSIIGGIGTLILFYGAKYIAYNMLQIPEAEYTLVALSPSIFFVAISSVVRGYFNGRQNLKATANSQTIEQVFKTCLTIIIVAVIGAFSSNNTIIMAAGANLATTLSTFLSFAYLYLYYGERKKEIAQDIKSSTNYKAYRIKDIIKTILSVSIPISLSSLMSVITKNIDAITVVSGLKTFMTEASAKIQYGILAGKVDALTAVPLSLNIAFATALVPTIASAKAVGNIQIARERTELSLLITILIGLPCTVGMFVFAPQILNLLFPNANRGELLLQISSLTIIFSVLIQTVNAGLQGIGKIMVPATALGIGVIVKYILNLILIKNPSIGVYGAGIASLCCNVVVFLIGITVLIKNMKLQLDLGKFVIKPILSTGMMAIVSLYVYNVLQKLIANQLATVISIACAGIIYIISLLILKNLTKEEIYKMPKGDKIVKALQILRLSK